jgi:RND family efflux transporter MFP subunit
MRLGWWSKPSANLAFKGDGLFHAALGWRCPRAQSLGMVLLGAVLAATAASCKSGKGSGSSGEIPAVPVAHPEKKEITDYVDFTGRLDAVHSVNIIPRVTGYLVKMPFREGSDVKAGDLLFEVDPRPYQAQFDQQASQVSLSKAQFDLAVSTLKRYKDLKKESSGAVSDQVIDQYEAAVAEAKERVTASQKSLEVYKLNKEFTQVVSPINGQVSRYYLTLGNLVNQDQTLLTTVVSLDPIYAYFEMDEETLNNITRLINQGKIKSFGNGAVPLAINGASNASPIVLTLASTTNLATGQIAAVSDVGGNSAANGIWTITVVDGTHVSLTGSTGNGAYTSGGNLVASGTPVRMSVQGEDDFPHEGFINFVNNQVNASTGSISVRGVFPNPKSEKGERILRPGNFARIHLLIGEPHESLLVVDGAIQSVQEAKSVYVVDPKTHIVEARTVTTGAMQGNGQRVITSGLKETDWVVVGGLQQVHPKGEVTVQELDKMPTVGNKSSAGSGSASSSGSGTAESGKPSSQGK